MELMRFGSELSVSAGWTADNQDPSLPAAWVEAAVKNTWFLTGEQPEGDC